MLILILACNTDKSENERIQGDDLVFYYLKAGTFVILHFGVLLYIVWAQPMESKGNNIIEVINQISFLILISPLFFLTLRQIGRV